METIVAKPMRQQKWRTGRLLENDLQILSSETDVYERGEGPEYVEDPESEFYCDERQSNKR